jgi:hypothetical protein
MSIPTRLDLESQLFAILKTLKTVHKDMLCGKISYSSYCTIVHRKIKELMLVELIFQAKGFDLDSILKEMDLSEEFFSLIPHLQNSLIAADSSPPLSQTYQSSLSEVEKNLADLAEKEKITAQFGDYAIHPLILAQLSSDITYGFITIFDFFKLKLQDYQLLEDSFERVEKALKKFPGLDNLYLDYKDIVRKVKSDPDKENSQNHMESFEKIFQRYLAALKNPKNMYP